ncbi:SAM-dependent methyltransferase [Haliangium ochraceum]|uniref:Methyltransferase type 11 n=1 Tax=Haliangium ochraceum (strain DSM 14365 / JCM 11303 / SMP-2) TaxID=502025 RepID=D0LT75_HALO1|nr:methyltransferase domain-containing protein [Haliangium ochraceum]ACY19211.1 Methyltransferase type 11 [Haliangium ochraceum DSM 14365]
MSNSAQSASAVEVSEKYYDSAEADNFYFHVWGGEDIHIGLYPESGGAAGSDGIAEASRRTVERMAGQLDGLGADSRVIDFGAGYGGAARFLAARYGCSVTCLNLSETQNRRNRALTAEQGLSERVDVIHGSFESVPVDDDSYDVVWSQDAFLHSGDRRKVFAEARRVLRPGGELILTDPMQADDCPDGVLQPVLDRIHLSSLGSVAVYRGYLRELGFEEVAWLDCTHQLRQHYARVAEVLRERYDEMVERSTAGYVDRMLKGLGHWVAGADSGHLAWGILHARLAA